MDAHRRGTHTTVSRVRGDGAHRAGGEGGKENGTDRGSGAPFRGGGAHGAGGGREGGGRGATGTEIEGGETGVAGGSVPGMGTWVDKHHVESPTPS